MDILTDLFDDSRDAARRRTVAAQRATQDIPLDPAQERRVAALLHGHYTTDDITAVAPVLQLPPDYLHNAETTDTVDRQVTLMLLEKATQLCGIGNFRICRGNFGANASTDPQTAAIQQRLQSYRLILSPAILDTIEQHSDTSGGERLDPRSVSVAWLLSTTPPEHPAAQPPDSNVEQNRPVESAAPSAARRTASPSWWRRWFT